MHRGSKRKHCIHRVLVAFLFLAALGFGWAEDREAVADSKDGGEVPTPRANEGYRFSSKKTDAEKEAEAGRGPKLGSPHGPAMDGIRGSAVAPAPGAFGTDAGSPDDLRR